MQVEGGTVEVVNHFKYLGSNISRDGEVTVEIDCIIAKASRAFGCLRKPIFQDRNLSIATKRQVHRAVVLSVLLYGDENLGTEGPTCKASELLSQLLHNPRCDKVPAVEGENNICTSSINLWHAAADI